MTAHARPMLSADTAARQAAVIREVQARCPIADDRSVVNGDEDGQDDRVPSGRDADVAANNEDNRRWQQWP